MASFMDNFKKFPLRVTVIKSYDNGLDFVTYEGAYQLQESKTKDGVKQKRRLVVRTGRFGQYFQLPWPSGKAQGLGDSSTRICYLQTDVNSFYPVTFQKGWLVAEFEEPMVQPVLGADGKPVLGEDGSPLVQQVVDELGVPRMVKKDVPLMAGGSYLKDGKLKQIPYAVANNVGSIVEWLAGELQDARREERPKSQSLMEMMTTFGPWIALVIVAIFGGQAIMSFGQSLQTATTINAESARMIANATTLMAQALNAKGIPIPPVV